MLYYIFEICYIFNIIKLSILRRVEMKIIKPSVELISNIDEVQVYQMIELAGRTAYKSEDLIDNNS